MELLDAVNLIMPKLGERAVTSVVTKHPTLAVLLPIMEQTRKNALRRGWWFNEFKYTAFPAPDGTIEIGVSVLSFTPEYPSTAVQRGTYLFNPETMSDKFQGPVRGVSITDVEFRALPESMATYVLYAAAIEMISTDIGVTQEIQVWQSLAGQAWSDVLAEHLKNKQYSTRKSRRWRSLVGAMKS